MNNILIYLAFFSTSKENIALRGNESEVGISTLDNFVKPPKWYLNPKYNLILRVGWAGGQSLCLLLLLLKDLAYSQFMLTSLKS